MHKSGSTQLPAQLWMDPPALQGCSKAERRVAPGVEATTLWVFSSTLGPRHQRSARSSSLVADALRGKHLAQSHAVRWRCTAAHEAKGTLRFAAACRARHAMGTHLPPARRPTLPVMRAFGPQVLFDSTASSKRVLLRLPKRRHRPRVAALVTVQQLLLIETHCDPRRCSQCQATRSIARKTSANETTLSGSIGLKSVNASIGLRGRLRRRAARNSIPDSKANQGKTMRVEQAAKKTLDLSLALNQNDHENTFNCIFCCYSAMYFCVVPSRYFHSYAFYSQRRVTNLNQALKQKERMPSEYPKLPTIP